MTTKNVTIRMDSELKEQAEELFNDLGLNMTTAVTAFIKQSVREQRIPFELTKNISYDTRTEGLVDDKLVMEVSRKLMKKNKEAYRELAK